jgi:hypothetical protein
MSLGSRIRALEARITELRGDGYCSTCGGLPNARAYIIASDDSPLPECSECGRPLDRDGRPVDGGNGRYKRYIIEDGLPLDPFAVGTLPADAAVAEPATTSPVLAVQLSSANNSVNAD